MTASEVIKKLIPLGVMVNLNETIDFDTAALVAEELGAKVEKEIIVTIEEMCIRDSQQGISQQHPDAGHALASMQLQ